MLPDTRKPNPKAETRLLADLARLDRLQSPSPIERLEAALGNDRLSQLLLLIALWPEEEDRLVHPSLQPGRPDRTDLVLESVVTSPSELIDERIRELDDWRGETLARIRALIKEADPDVVEEWKWKGTPTWYHDGIICTGETYKSVVKTTFAKGASLDDPSGLFNSSLEGNVRRAIDFREGEEIDEQAFKALVRAAVDLNTG